MLQRRRDGLTGLTLESLAEQFAAEGVAELHHQLFQLGEGSPPGRTIRTVEVVQQVFGGRLQDRT